MWNYEKRLLYPVNIKRSDAIMARRLCARCCGENSAVESAAYYLTHRYTMPTDQTRALLTDIGTEELGHG